MLGDDVRHLPLVLDAPASGYQAGGEYERPLPPEQLPPDDQVHRTALVIQGDEYTVGLSGCHRQRTGYTTMRWTR